MSTLNFSLLISAAGVAVLLAAALHDVMSRTVPNRFAVAVAVAGLVSQGAQFAAGQGHPFVALPTGVGVFVGAALLWRRGLMGGADVKLLGASALLFPPILVPSLLAAVAMAGGLLASVYLVTRRRLARPGPERPPGLLARVVRAEQWRLRRGGPLPYAVAIAGGACFVLSNQLFSVGVPL